MEYVCQSKKRGVAFVKGVWEDIKWRVASMEGGWEGKKVGEDISGVHAK